MVCIDSELMLKCELTGKTDNVDFTTLRWLMSPKPEIHILRWFSSRQSLALGHRNIIYAYTQ